MKTKDLQVKFLLSIVVLALILPMGAFAVENTAVDKSNTVSVSRYSITEPYEYPVTPDDAEWVEFDSHQEMIDACQIPEEILNNMSTEALVETVLNYPLLYDMLVWENQSHGAQSVISSFNGLSELLSREDGPELLADVQTQKRASKTASNGNVMRCISAILNEVDNKNMTTYALPQEERGGVRTPKGSLVWYYKDLDFVDLANLFEDVPFTQSEFDDLEASYKKTYPKAEKIGPISPRPCLKNKSCTINQAMRS